MNSPVKPPAKPGQTAVDDRALNPIPSDGLYYGLYADAVDPQWKPVVEEAPSHTSEKYVRTGLHSWVPAVAGGKSVTEIVPTMATVGLSAALPANVYGNGFIDGDVVMWDGVALATSFISANQLGITIDTNLGVSPSVAVVTVVGATGAVGFHFIPSGGQYHFDTGLSFDDVTREVDLTPAGTTAALLGGVYVPTRDATQAADVDTSGGDGKLVVLTATNTLLGGILEPPLDGMPYDRQWNETDQKWEWVPSTGTQYHFVLGLTHDDTTGDVNLTPAGWAPELLGGVYTAGGRSATEGLDLNIAGNGLISAPLATDLLAGTFTEPPQDGLPYARKFDTTVAPGKWIWEPTVAAGLQITGLIPDNVMIPSTTPVAVTAYGAEFTPTCVIRIDGVDVVPPATIDPARPTTAMFFTIDPTPELVGRIVTVTVHDPAAVPPALVDGMGAEPFEFQELVEALYRGRWQPATNAPDIVTLTKEDQWMWVADIVDPAVPEAPLVALPGVDPAVTIKEGDHLVWDATAGAFLVISSGALPVHYGQGLTFDDATRVVDLQPAGSIVDHMGGVWVPPRTELQGLEIDPNFTGELRAPLATDLLAGSIIEPPPDDKGYVRRRTPAGESAWVPPADPMDTNYGIGLSFNETTRDVDLQPAGDGPPTLGGVYVIDRERNNTEGLELGLDGRLRVPLATDSLAGAIVEPPPDDKGYVRRRDLNGVSAWVPPADPADTHYVIGLTHDDVTGDVNLTPAGDAPEFLGGVYVIDRSRNVTEGLELGIDGRLRVPLATDNLAGAIVEPPPDDKGYVRRRDLAGVSAWVPPSDTVYHFVTGLSFDETTRDVNLTAAGDSPATLGGVYVIDRERNNTEGLELGLDGRLRVPLATDSLAGSIVEPPDDGKGYVRRREAGLSAWVPPSDTVYHFVLGLSFDESTRDVNLSPAGWSPELLGGVYGEMRSATNGLDLSITGNGFITAPLATDQLAGTHTEPPPDGLAYSRQWDNVTDPANPKWVWVPALTAGLQITGLIPDRAILGPTEPVVTVHAFGSQFTPTTVIVVDGTDASATTYVSPTELTFQMNPAVPVGEVTHVITVRDPAATPPEGLGAESFEFIKSSTSVEYGIGLTLDTSTTPDPTVNLDPAGPLPADLGGVYVPARNENQGLQLGADGRLIAPKATDTLAGVITEPPPDDRQYARVRSPTTGQSEWMAVQSSVVIIADAPPDVAMTPPGTLWWESDSGDLFIMYDDGTSKQWVEAVAGADPGIQTHISDAPPAAANPGDLWWDSDAGTLAVYYQDADTTQWVQIAGPQPPPPAAGGGIAEAPVDGQPYSRQDAGWVLNTVAAGAFLPLTGGTVTGPLNVAEGPLTLTKTSAVPGADPTGAFLVLNRTDPAQGVGFIAQNAGVESWKMILSSGEIPGLPGYGDKIQFVRSNAIQVEIDASGNMVVSGNLTIYGTFTDALLMSAVEADPTLPGRNVTELLLHALAEIKSLKARLAICCPE